MKSLAGKAAIVTGGGSGIGCATAKLLAEAGAQVALVDYNERVVFGVQKSIRVNGIMHFPGSSISLMPLELSRRYCP